MTQNTTEMATISQNYCEAVHDTRNNEKHTLEKKEKKTNVNE